MAQAVTIRCPNCNGVVTYDADARVAVCEYCGHSFEPGELGVEAPLAAEGEGVEQAFGHLAHAETVSDFMERAPWAEPREDAAHVRGYTCPTCAAKLLTDVATAATSCPYCGNNVLVPAAAHEEDVPRYVLPFSITKDRAKQRLAAHVASINEEYLPEHFKAELEHIQGVYVPYYLFDVHMDGAVGLAGWQSGMPGKPPIWRSYASWWAFGEADFLRVPVDCSSKMPDGHMEALAPFDLTALRPLATEYLAGYLMEVPDESEERAERRAAELARASFEQIGSEYVSSRVGRLHVVGEPSGDRAAASMTQARLCALPVWLLHCTWRGKDLLFGINGQTGECVGNLPVNTTRRLLSTYGTWFAVVILAILLLAIFPVAALVFVPWALYRHDAWDDARMREIESAVKPTDSLENQASQKVRFVSWEMREAANKKAALSAIRSTGKQTSQSAGDDQTRHRDSLVESRRPRRLAADALVALVMALRIGLTFATYTPTMYTIAFLGNGADSGSMPTIECEERKAFTFPECTYQRDGYYFTGWSATPYALEASRKPGDSRFASCDVTYYAVWEDDDAGEGSDSEGASSSEPAWATDDDAWSCLALTDSVALHQVLVDDEVCAICVVGKGSYKGEVGYELHIWNKTDTRLGFFPMFYVNSPRAWKMGDYGTLTSKQCETGIWVGGYDGEFTVELITMDEEVAHDTSELHDLHATFGFEDWGAMPGANLNLDFEDRLIALYDVLIDPLSTSDQ